jgi:hypothetical protein
MEDETVMHALINCGHATTLRSAMRKVWILPDEEGSVVEGGVMDGNATVAVFYPTGGEVAAISLGYSMLAAKETTQVWYTKVRAWMAQGGVHIFQGGVCWICVENVYNLVTVGLSCNLVGLGDVVPEGRCSCCVCGGAPVVMPRECRHMTNLSKKHSASMSFSFV